MFIKCVLIVHIPSSNDTFYKIFKVIIYNIIMGTALETQNNIASFWSQGFGNIHGAFKSTL